MTVVNVYHAPNGQDVSQKILERAKEILETSDVEFKLVSVSSPNTPKVIADMAEKENFDLVVVDSRGTGAVQAYLIGSVCNKLCYDSPVSVPIVN